MSAFLVLIWILKFLVLLHRKQRTFCHFSVGKYTTSKLIPPVMSVLQTFYIWYSRDGTLHSYIFLSVVWQLHEWKICFFRQACLSSDKHRIYFFKGIVNTSLFMVQQFWAQAPSILDWGKHSLPCSQQPEVNQEIFGNLYF